MNNIRVAVHTIRDLGKQRIQLIRKKHPEISGFFLLKSIAVDFFSGLVKVIASRYYLRGSELGKWVSVNGKPLIVNEGRMSIGNNVQIWSKIEKSKMIVKHGATLVIGDNSFINGAHISTSLKIEIGKNVRIGPYTIIMDDDFHDVYDHSSAGKRAAIIIEDDVWIATRVVILKGVTIGKGAVVATGAVVTRSVEPYSIVGGVPARRIK